MTNIQPKFSPLVRNDAAGSKSVNTAAPKADQVIDLTDKKTVQTELETTDASFIKVKLNNKEAYFELPQMDASQKKAFVDGLKQSILGNGGVREAFNPETFFSISKHKLNIGTPSPSTSTAQIASAQDILEKSLSNKDDDIFLFMNGSTHQLSAAGTKPTEWNNGFEVKKNAAGEYEVTVTGSANGRPAPKLNIDEYKKMVIKDFNFNGAVSAITNECKDVKLAEKKFVNSVLAKFDPQHPTLKKDELTQIAKDIWSYATTGADTKGEISIPHLQGMMTLLDPEVAKAGSNNNMQATDIKTAEAYKQLKPEEQAKYFQIGDRFAPVGDEAHGRSTILQTRHLMETFKPEQPMSMEIESLFGGYDGTILLTDISTSMTAEMEQFAKLINAGGIDGAVKMGTFYDNSGAGQLKWHNEGATDWFQSVDAASKLAKHDAPAFKLPENAGQGEKGFRESGIKSAIRALSEQKTVDAQIKRQLVVFTDETDSDPASLDDLQKLAKEKGFDVKVLISHQEDDPVASTFSVIKLNDVDFKSAMQENLVNSKNSVTNGNNTLDWKLVAKQQNAKELKWSDFAK